MLGLISLASVVEILLTESTQLVIRSWWGLNPVLLSAVLLSPAPVIHLCLSWHKDIVLLHLRLGAQRYRPPWPSLAQLRSAADRVGLLSWHLALICLSRTSLCFSHRSHSESGSRLITHLFYCRILWQKSLSLSHTPNFSELILLVVPIVWWLPEPYHWLALSWFRVSLTSCNEMQGLIS